MPPKKSPADPAPSRGAKRMREKGHKLVQLWLDRHEAQIMAAAAAEVRKPLATWIRQQAVHAAQAAALARVRAARRDARDE